MALIASRTYLPYILAGELQYCFNLEHAVDVRTPTGAIKTTWVRLDKLWASKIPLRGVQLFYAQSFAPEATGIIRCRYRTDVLAGMRLTDDFWSYTVMRPPVDLEGNNAVLLLYVRELRMAGPVVDD